MRNCINIYLNALSLEYFYICKINIKYYMIFKDMDGVI